MGLTETVTDADGNVYTTVKIGNQIWTAENLMTTNYNDGERITLVTNNSKWKEFAISEKAAYCWYENEIINKEKYGALYNWYSVNTGKLAPKGWHVPTEEEWLELESYLNANSYNWDGTKKGFKIAKALAAKTDWVTDTTLGTIGSDLSKNNLSDFSALPGGFRNDNGFFKGQGSDGYWWSATDLAFFPSQASMRNLRYNLAIRNTGSHKKGCGFSLRLVRD